MKVHRAGVAHGNFTRRNIVSWDDDLEWLRLVNFQAASEHNCCCTVKSIDTTKTLSWGDIRCHELYYACVKAQLCFCKYTVTLYLMRQIS